jgi:hypothetical protein
MGLMDAEMQALIREQVRLDAAAEEEQKGGDGA